MNTTEAIQLTNQAATNKAKAKKAVLLSLGTLALGTLAFFGIKHFKKQKNENNDDNSETINDLDTKIPVQTRPANTPRAGVSTLHAGNAFPLALRSKGDKVLQLQQSLMRAFGSGIFPKYGADGIFGTELRDFLRTKGYAVPLSEADFKKITQTQAAPSTLVVFDPAAIAKGIYNAMVAKDYSSCITLLKAITNPTNYSLVSARFKLYRLNGGVTQTLVNAMFNTFPEVSQRETTKQAFLKMGLKHNPATDKWSLNGRNNL